MSDRLSVSALTPHYLGSSSFTVSLDVSVCLPTLFFLEVLLSILDALCVHKNWSHFISFSRKNLLGLWLRLHGIYRSIEET